MTPTPRRTFDRGIRLFEHPLLDWGSRVHPALPLLFWGPISLGLIVRALWGSTSAGAVAVSVVVGFFGWFLAEYAIHRWFFHFRPRSLRMRRLFYLVHEHHHRYQERDRLLAPPLMSLAIGGMLALAFLAVMPWIGVDVMLAFAGGFAAGYLCYDYTHYLIHFARPRTRWGRYVRRCHLEHHFSTPERWFCISIPWVDYLFGTAGLRGPKSSRPEIEPHDLWDDESLPPLVRAYEAEEHHKQTVSPGSP